MFFLLRPSRGAEYYDELACLWICVSVRCEHISETIGPNFTDFFSAHVACGLG